MKLYTKDPVTNTASHKWITGALRTKFEVAWAELAGGIWAIRCNPEDPYSFRVYPSWETALQKLESLTNMVNGTEAYAAMIEYLVDSERLDTPAKTAVIARLDKIQRGFTWSR